VSRQIKHGQSHALLLQEVSAGFQPGTRSRLDAIVVPAARASLQRSIALSAELSVPLVLLCSRQAKIDKIAERVEGTFGARALIVEVPEGYRLPQENHLTSDRRFTDLSADRSSDINRLAGTLDRHPVAAMASRYFPDNSVVCHARRLAGLKQDVFVSGAVLGVNPQHPAQSFFPDIYNEDWFFFSRHAAGRSLPKIGEVVQDEYKPFADPSRAAREEFGDLLAEGLYALFESMPGWDFGDQLSAATNARHWRGFKQKRLAIIDETSKALDRGLNSADSIDYPTFLQAQESLRYAENQLPAISAEACVDFIERWREDEHRWQDVLKRSSTIRGERDALDELELRTWISCGYGTNRISARPPSRQPAESEADLCSA